VSAARPGPLRRLLTHPRVEPVVATILRSSVVRVPPRFVARELAGRKVTGAYRLREAPLTVLVRHGTPDVVTLDEVFLTRDYEVPREVSERLSAAPAVLDLGANAGYFGLYALAAWPDARLTAVEADPANVDVLRRLIAANRVPADRWRVVAACAAERAGEVEFLAGAFSLSRLAAAGAAPPGARSLRVPAVDALALLEEADVAKIDIEGGEWAIVCDPRFPAAAPPALVLEYHPELCPEPDPHALARRRLEAAGLTVREVWSRADGHGILWGWKPAG
jgi:FkbM family methyltransferase